MPECRASAQIRVLLVKQVLEKAMQDGFEVDPQSSTFSGSCRAISDTVFLDDSREEIGYEAPGSAIHGKLISLVSLNVRANRNCIPPCLTNLTATSYSA